jgi:penicillin-insensitive murein endopeptidase
MAAQHTQSAVGRLLKTCSFETKRGIAGRVRVVRALLGLLAVAAWLVAALPFAASARGAIVREIDLRPPPGMRSRSLGFAWQGQILRAMRVQESEYIRYVGEYASGGNFYGTWELVQLLERAARRVAFRLPGSKLQIGELSGPTGGRVDGHRSHQSGRDVDIGFYVTLADRTPLATYAFAEFDRRGHGLPPNQYLRFDDARNWELIAKLLTDGEARVQFIFVASALKQRLLDEARRRGAAKSVIERAKTVLAEPGHGHPHRNHFHVRIYCPPADRAVCKERGPFWPWYPGAEPPGGYTKLSSPFVVEDP